MVLSVRGPRLLMWEAQDCIRLQGPIVHIMRVFSLPCRMVQEVVKQLGGLHIAINNAGINKNAAAEDTTEEDWDMTFDVNTKGVFLCCQVGVLQVVACSCAARCSVCCQEETRLPNACISGMALCCQEVRKQPA